MNIVNRIRVELDGVPGAELGHWSIRLGKLGVRMNGNLLIIARLGAAVTIEDEDFVYYALKDAAAQEGVRIIRVDPQSTGEFRNEAGKWFIKRYRVNWNRQATLVQ